jgi:SAM-dependent methyltransferase
VQQPYDVPTSHDFFDEDHNRRFAAQQDARPERQLLFDGFVREIQQRVDRSATVLEIGSGYGALAEAILGSCSPGSYHLFDFSPQMHELSRERLERFKDKTHYHVGNFRESHWAEGLPAPFDVIVTLQTVHELRHADRIPHLYRQINTLLRVGGLFLVSDIVNTPELHRDHCLTPDQHIELLASLGFDDVSVALTAGGQPLIRATRTAVA